MIAGHIPKPRPGYLESRFDQIQASAVSGYTGSKKLNFTSLPDRDKELKYMPGYTGYLPSTRDVYGQSKTKVVEGSV